jgi:vitamin B12/bleomycin/antimicrobial peptide transport system ATP-binding/permease protein
MILKGEFFVQFIKLAGPFWNSADKQTVRKDSFLLAILTVMQIVLAVITNDWNAALFDAIEQHSMSGIIRQIGVLAIIFAGSILVTTWHLIVKRRLQLGWRDWLTERVVSMWMHKGRHYQITFMAKDNHDNPDVRIAEDIRIATEDAISMAHSLFYSLLLLVSFTQILWGLSGRIVLDLGLFTVNMGGYLVWVAVIYASAASVLGWWMGRPLTESTNIRQSEEANYRYCLIKMRENSESIALIHGEENEKRRFRRAFQAIIDAYDQQTAAWRQIQLFSSGYSVLSMGLPILVAAPRYIAGTITLGTLMQAVQAFQQMVSALSWPVNNLAGIASWRASVERVLGLVKALEELESDISCLNSHQLCVGKSEKGKLNFENVTIASLEGETLSATINVEIGAGEHTLLTGLSGTGAKLFQAVAGLWPWGGGRILIPEGERLFFMSPRPYLPSGTLAEAICYPKTPEAFKSADLEKYLKKLDLKTLIPRLEQREHWEKLLSREQQQRLGAVRALLYRPKWLFIQEAMDSLTHEDEVNLLILLNKELPGVTILNLTNQPSVKPFHTHHITICQG